MYSIVKIYAYISNSEEGDEDFSLNIRMEKLPF
jgi:hypothetical protein